MAQVDYADCVVVRSPTRRTVLNERDERHPNGEVQVGGLNPTLVGRTPTVDRLIEEKDAAKPRLIQLHSAKARELAEAQAEALKAMGQGVIAVEQEPELVLLAEHEEAAAHSRRARSEEKADQPQAAARRG
jgi:hypothetical protein